MNRGPFLGALIAVALAVQPGHAQEPFYKGKRFTILVNFAPGGATDAEARVLARHIGPLIDGQPGIVIQYMEGAVGLTGAKYIGEIAPRDGTLAGYLTGTAFLYALDPERSGRPTRASSPSTGTCCG
jgi:tripartite-type tricarboxylate transporter receptor subunit TctC